MKGWARYWALAGVWLATGCGSPCAGDASSSPDAPAIDHLSALTGTVEGDPWEVMLVADFHDADGDLGHGQSDVSLDGRDPPTELDLFDLFRGSALALDATQGRLTIPLRFSDSVHDGSDVRVGLQLVDEAGHRSNCRSVDLRFNVSQVARRLERGVSALWARL